MKIYFYHCFKFTQFLSPKHFLNLMGNKGSKQKGAGGDVADEVIQPIPGADASTSKKSGKQLPTDTKSEEPKPDNKPAVKADVAAETKAGNVSAAKAAFIQKQMEQTATPAKIEPPKRSASSKVMESNAGAVAAMMKGVQNRAEVAADPEKAAQMQAQQEEVEELAQAEVAAVKEGAILNKKSKKGAESAESSRPQSAVGGEEQGRKNSETTRARAESTSKGLQSRQDASKAMANILDELAKQPKSMTDVILSIASL
jgi:hypothetical protein